MIRALCLSDVEVFAKRAEDFPVATADVVTLRAVERFDSVLPVAAGLVAPDGQMVLLIGSEQVARACAIPGWKWQAPHPIPGSQTRVVLSGIRMGAST